MCCQIREIIIKKGINVVACFILPGPSGAPGAPGAPGISGCRYVRASGATASCLSGEVALGCYGADGCFGAYLINLSTCKSQKCGGYQYKQGYTIVVCCKINKYGGGYSSHH